MKLKKFKAGLVFALTAVCACLPMTACKNDTEQQPAYKAIEENDFLKTEGELVKNRSGETVTLRGVNAGGLFVTEHWMTGFLYNVTERNDYKSLTQTFIDRFGEDKTKALWAEYRANWWSETDFKICADTGMNVIRLPFTYMNVDFDAITDYANAGKNYDFSALDAFVTKAAEYGMYTILDLHGAYGSQNGKDHSGQVNNDTVDFYSNDEMQTLTVKLWDALSEHYKNNPAVAGYDILNEPGEHAGSTGERHWNFFDKVYDAIRENNDEHIVIFESCWNGENLPKTSRYGWENCIYSFHHYTDSNLSVNAHNLDWNKKITDVCSQNFGVPLQMGEFNNYTSPEKWDYTLDLMYRTNWHWTSWTYKIWGKLPWGIVNVSGANDNKVNAAEDGYDEILQKFKRLRTDGEYVSKYEFAGGRTLEVLMTEYFNAPARAEKLEEGNYQLFCGEDYLAVTLKNVSGGIRLTVSEFLYDRMTFTVQYCPENDGSVYLIPQGSPYKGYLSVNSSGDFVTVSDSTRDAKFYPVITEDGLAFISYSSCGYLKTDGDGIFRADGNRTDAAIITSEKINED